MKTATFQLKGKEYMLVGFDNNTGDVTDDLEMFKDIKGTLGKLSDITEDRYKDLVDNHQIPFGDMGFCYPDYAIKFGFKAFDTAKESFFSKLKAEGIMFENNRPHPSDIEPYSRADYDNLTNEWQSAQEKVWNIENTYLFIKESQDLK